MLHFKCKLTFFIYLYFCNIYNIERINILKDYNYKLLKNTKIDRKKGITLLALVITIVIMLLLAAIAIQMAIGDNRTY